MLFHRLVGIALAVLYVSARLGIFDKLVGLELSLGAAEGKSGLHRASRGVLYVDLIVFGTAYLLAFPKHAAEKFSPRSGAMKAYVIPPAIWVVFGYIGLLANVLLYEVFK